MFYNTAYLFINFVVVFLTASYFQTLLYPTMGRKKKTKSDLKISTWDRNGIFISEFRIILYISYIYIVLYLIIVSAYYSSCSSNDKYS